MAFEDACTGCGDCARACPEAIVLRDPEGFPVVDIRQGACTFCGACTAACEAGALVADGGFPWVAAIAAAECLALNGIQCRACEDHCEARAIRFRPAPGGRARPDIATDLCTGCGACAAPCPGGAIHLEFQPSKEPAPC